jgi:hypothetical protein
MTTQQVEFTETELLMDHDFAEPLVANGQRCHGGFDEDGTYVSPRTRFRAPAIEAWEEQRREQFGTEALAIPVDTWPTNFPNIEQSKLLIRSGAPEPTISALTRIGTVEGFGSMLRLLPTPDLQPNFVDSIAGTATDHIRKGLFEAHARDEAGFEDEAGHDRMWFAARDIAFENPVTTDQTEAMMRRLGVGTPPGSPPPDLAKLRAEAMANRVLPDDVDFDLEAMLNRMISLLFIEIAAFHGFIWAEGVLSDTDVCAGDGEAAKIISYIRADETPHVAYLQVALSEMRDRTWAGADGRTYEGAEMVQRIWDRQLELSRFLKRGENLTMAVREVELALEGRTDKDDVMEEFFRLGTVTPLADGGFLERNRAGEDVLIPA